MKTASPADLTLLESKITAVLAELWDDEHASPREAARSVVALLRQERGAS